MSGVWVVMPAYNAEKTLKECYEAIPEGSADHVLLVDDCSSDGTVDLARTLGIETIVHERNRGYGGNQKTCYRTALDRGAEFVVMVHPDHQYDPRAIPELIRAMKENDAGAAFGSRMLGGKYWSGGMPWWKFIANVGLTAMFNITTGHYLTEIHSGFRAYSRRYLEAIDFEANSDNFVFDTEIILQGIASGTRFVEIPIETRYFDEASQISFRRSVRYGLGILKRLLLYRLTSRYRPKR